MKRLLTSLLVAVSVTSKSVPYQPQVYTTSTQPVVDNHVNLIVGTNIGTQVFVITNGFAMSEPNLDAATAFVGTNLLPIILGPGTYNATNQSTNAMCIKGAGMTNTVIVSYVNSLGGLLAVCDNSYYSDFQAQFAPTIVNNSGITTAFFGNYNNSPMQTTTFNNAVIRNISCPQPASDFIYINQAATTTNFDFDHIYGTTTNGVWDWVVLAPATANYSGIIENCFLQAFGTNIYPSGVNLSHCLNLGGGLHLLCKNNVFECSNTNGMNILVAGGAGVQFGLTLVGNTFITIPLGGTTATNIYFDARLTSYMVGRGNLFLTNNTGASANLQNTVFYRLRSVTELFDLFPEQSGVTNVSSATSFTATFQIPFPDTNYVVAVNAENAALASENITSKTTTNCVVNMTAFTGAIEWAAIHP